MRQEFVAEGLSQAQRWILAGSDEDMDKLDADDNKASESFKATDLPTSHDHPEITREDVNEAKGLVISYFICNNY